MHSACARASNYALKPSYQRLMPARARRSFTSVVLIPARFLLERAVAGAAAGGAQHGGQQQPSEQTRVNE